MPQTLRRAHRDGPGGVGCSGADALAEADLRSSRRMYTSKGRRMAPPNKPVVGNLYDMEQQHEMHGGALQKCAPTKDGDFTLLRLIPEHNADAPYIVDWE
jgi:hypothetical protein